MIPYDSLLNAELELIDNCVDRATLFLSSVRRCDIELSLVKAHTFKPLELELLFGFDDANFLHDIAGIVKHVDSCTGSLVDFNPRCGYL